MMVFLTKLTGVSRFAVAEDLPVFDILRIQSDGSEQCVGKAPHFSSAALYVELLAFNAPGKYMIRDRKTNHTWAMNFQKSPQIHTELLID
jgi:hypothetical protein